MRHYRPDVVGLSLRNIDNVVRQHLRRHLEAVPALIAAIRAETGAPAVLGGPAVSLLGSAALARLDADYAVLGEGEAVFPALLASLAAGRDPEEVADEIERVQAVAGPRSFEFVDATFNLPAEHAKAVCEAIVRRGLRVHLTTMGINPLGVDAELLALMRRAGFNSLMASPEAASDATLQGLRKGFALEDVACAAQLACASGLDCAWFFMLGGPGETRATVEETVGFAERHLSWKNSLSIFVTGIRILPGTALAEIARAEGRLAPDADLAAPVFYLSPAASEDWILARVNAAAARCPGIVHAAEEGRSLYERAMYRLLSHARVAPPYWRFLPALLRLPPLRALRRAYPPVGRRAAH